MSFPRYPAYKDSGVTWFGEVPKHWQVAPLKAFIDRIESGVSVNATDTPAEGEQFGVLKTSCVYTGQFDAAENKAVVNAEYDRVACPVVANTLIVSRMNTPDLVGAAGLTKADHPTLFLPDRLWQVFPKDTRADFMHFWTRTASYRAQVEMACAGTSSSMQNLGQDDFRSFMFVSPPPDEQAEIADFLDRETAKIDALVAEQEQLINLLKEKRQAVISHAVTKGLDPSVPMKDSGVEWLGEVPAHWSVQPLGTLTRSIQTGPFGSQLHSDEYVDDATPVINPSNIIDGQLCPEPSATVTDEVVERLTHHKLIEGDIVVGRRGEMGRCAVVMKPQVGWLCGTGCLKIQLNSTALPEFVWRYLSTETIKQYLSLQSVGSTMENLNTQILARVPVPVPSATEQAAICDAVSGQLKALAALESEAIGGVRLLQERRSALISASVTGQIDVRGLATQETS